MKKLNLLSVVIAMATLVLSTRAVATPMFDVFKDTPLDVNTVLSASGTDEEWIDIEYDSRGWGSILSATLVLKISDDADPSNDVETARIQQIESNTSPGLTSYGPLVSMDPLWYGFVDVSNYLELGSVNTLDVLLEATAGDFEYHNALMFVIYEPLSAQSVNPTINPASVPEPFTVGLMGMGLLGAVGAAKRKRS